MSITPAPAEAPTRRRPTLLQRLLHLDQVTVHEPAPLAQPADDGDVETPDPTWPRRPRVQYIDGRWRASIAINYGIAASYHDDLQSAYAHAVWLGTDPFGEQARHDAQPSRERGARARSTR